MARLNEVPASTSTESLESLKRKFMRQNRDIARANSTQSLRIRALENEVAKLLADNLDLQGHVLRLQNELANGKAQRTAAHAQLIKSQLENKLKEIGALLGGLGQTPASLPKGKPLRASPSTSPSQRNWKNMCSLSEAMAGQEGRLPPILENKQYPRKTLENQEILSLIPGLDSPAQSTESPEIGPPPVSQFVDEEPVKIDLPQKKEIIDSDSIIVVGPALTFNLEQRKKRRESDGPVEQLENRTQQPSEVEESRPAVKTGAKRKLSVREDDDSSSKAPRSDSSLDNFKFSRVNSDEKTKSKVTNQPENTATKVTRELALPRGPSRERRPTSGAAPAASRKVLAPKSVNNSPKKAKAATLDEVKAAKANMPRYNPPKEHLREQNQETIVVKPETQPVAEPIDIQTEPETPATLGIFSPSSQPSTTRVVDNRDTPPPPDLNSGGEAVRPSRRARGAVSYAEPSLRDKMRRPGKELANAVTKDGKIIQGTAVKPEGGAISIVTIKAEPEDEDAWKHMAPASAATVENSPLRSKATEPDVLPSSITTHRKRRESVLHPQQLDPSKSGSETAISALIAEHRKAKAAAREKALEKEGPNSTKGVLDNHEFNGSSRPSSADIPETKNIKEERTTSRPPRRQSSVPRDLALQDDGEASDIEGTKRKTAVTSRRRQSTLGVRSGNTTQGTEKPSALKHSISANSISDSGPEDARSDRITARRRSMML